jgi:hypothetical protein
MLAAEHKAAYKRSLAAEASERKRKATQPWPVAEVAIPVAMGDKQGTLSVVRNRDELADAAKVLHNCATGRAERIADGGYAIAVLANSKGKLVAMGEYTKGKGWGQIYGPCNQPTPHADAIRAVGRQLSKLAFAGEQPTQSTEEPLTLEGQVNNGQ